MLYKKDEFGQCCIFRALWQVIIFICLVILGDQNTYADDSCNNSVSSCEAMCSHIYNNCSMGFVNSQGSLISETNCVYACGSTDPAVISCLSAVNCDTSSIDNCLITASVDNENDGSSYIGGGGVNDDSGDTTSGGDCGEITDCNSCITNCRCRYGGTLAASTCCTGCGCECELYCMPSEWWVATCL